MGGRDKSTLRGRDMYQRPSQNAQHSKEKNVPKTYNNIYRKPWMRWIKRKLIRVADRWNVEEAMAVYPYKQNKEN